MLFYRRLRHKIKKVIKMKKIVSAHEPDAAFISAKIRELRALYPFIQKRIIGKSCCGRPIYLLAIGAGEEKILISAGYHGSEWLTPLPALDSSRISAKRKTGSF